MGITKRVLKNEDRQFISTTYHAKKDEFCGILLLILNKLHRDAVDIVAQYALCDYQVFLMASLQSPIECCIAGHHIISIELNSEGGVDIGFKNAKVRMLLQYFEMNFFDNKHGSLAWIGLYESQCIQASTALRWKYKEVVSSTNVF